MKADEAGNVQSPGVYSISPLVYKGNEMQRKPGDEDRLCGDGGEASPASWFLI